MRSGHQPDAKDADGGLSWSRADLPDVELSERERRAEAEARSNRFWLYSGRGVRSFTTAFLTVIFPLYLAAEGYSATKIGLVLTVGGFVSAGLVLAVGFAGDRFGRRSVLAVICALGVVGGVVLARSADLVVVMVANGLCGVGRGGGAGSGGSFGAVFPVEQPLVTASAPAHARTATFARMSVIGVAAGAAGSLVGYLPEALHHAGRSWVASYQLVFLLSAVLSAVMLVTVFPIRERRLSTTASGHAGASSETGTRLSTGQLIRRLATVNMLNGFGFGFLGPLLVYWFHVRYGVGSGTVGVLYTIINLVTMAPYLVAAPLTRRLGSVRTVVYSRAAGLVFMVAMIFTPTFLLAGAAYAVRILVNSLGMPARQSYVMGVSDERHRSTIAAVGSLPSQLSSSVSPVVGGALMASFVDVPILGAIVFMGANTLGYYLSFRRHPPPEERPPTPTGPAST